MTKSLFGNRMAVFGKAKPLSNGRQGVNEVIGGRIGVLEFPQLRC